MEDYEVFVQQRLSQLRSDREEELRASVSSIRFYGRPILPPLLSGKQRVEMQHHREEMQKAADCRKLNVDPRMAYVQTILHSVQLRKTPTLDDLLQESEITAHSLSCHNTNNDSVAQRNVFAGTKESLSPKTASKENSGFSLPRLTSTTYSAFFRPDRTTQQPHHDGCLIDQQESQPNSFNGASHQSLSSGYMTCENVENSASVSRRIDAAGGSSEGFLNTGGFFHHNTSNTIAKMPDIISYPPVDGEELERSGLEASFGSHSLGVKDVSINSYQEDSIASDCFPAEKSDSSCLDDVEHVDDAPILSFRDESLDQVKNVRSDNPDINESLVSTMQIQYNSKEPDSSTSKESNRLSLQALLKKSQEYRRCQRLLRNQAKNSKIQARTHEQPRARTEQQSLSDKENDEFPPKDSATADGKKIKEKNGSSPPTVGPPTDQSWENKKTIEGENFLKNISDVSESKCLVEDANKLLSIEKETTLRHNRLNSSHKQSGALNQQQYRPAETFYLTTCSKAFHKGPRRNGSFPAPVFCRSPTRFKSRKSTRSRQTAGRDTLGKTLSAGLDEGNHLEHVNCCTKTFPTVNSIVEEDVTRVLAKSSLQIDQLESSLSVLKVLISDLELTVKEDLDNRCQNESKTQSESSFKHFEASQNDQLGQRKDEYWEEKLSDDDADCFKRLPRRSFNDSRLGANEIGPLQFQEGETETGTLMTQQKKSKEAAKKQSARCIFSKAQKMLIPEIFRNAEPEAASDISALSDTSDRSLGRREGTAIEGQQASRTPSLNQSYDVETPSGVWLRELSGSDTGSQGRKVQETHLTPESCGECQEGVSKVKRRLLIQQMEEKPDAVSPSCSTPRAALYCEANGALKDKQEQLKQIHAAQVRALQEQHRKQQEEFLQALAERYGVLQSVSFPCSMSGSHVGDALTFPSPSQLSGRLSQRCRPLLAAFVKGFLTRRLLRTERMAQLVRTIRDTQQFLQTLQRPPISGREVYSKQDFLLQERVTLQLRASRYEVYDIFFGLTVGEQMQLISWDRELSRERERRRQSGTADGPSGKGKSSLSAATRKSLERKRGVLMQKNAAERLKMRSRQKTGPSAEWPSHTKGGPFRVNPQRATKMTFSCRPR